MADYLLADRLGVVFRITQIVQDRVLSSLFHKPFLFTCRVSEIQTLGDECMREDTYDIKGQVVLLRTPERVCMT